MNKNPSTQTLTHTQEDAMWAQLHKEPDSLRAMPDATPDMQAYALRRRAYLIFEDIPWQINPEYICPGITAWKKAYVNKRKPEVSEQTIVQLIDMVSTFEPVRRLAFMPPEAVNSDVRKYLASAPFDKCGRTLNRVALKYWGSRKYPENDVQGRLTTLELGGAKHA